MERTNREAADHAVGAGINSCGRIVVPFVDDAGKLARFTPSVLPFVAAGGGSCGRSA